MALFGSKSKRSQNDPFNTVMGFLGAFAEGRASKGDAKLALSGVEVGEMLDALGNFASMLKPRLDDGQHRVIRQQLAAAEGSTEIRTAVAEIGEALLIEVDAVASQAALDRHEPRITEPGDTTRVALELIYAMARSAEPLKITFNWA